MYYICVLHLGSSVGSVDPFRSTFWRVCYFFFLCWYFIECGFVLSLMFCLCDVFVYITGCMHSTVSNPIVLYTLYLHKQTIHSKYMIIEVKTCITVMRLTYKLKDIHFRFLSVLGFLDWILSNVSNDIITKGCVYSIEVGF